MSLQPKFVRRLLGLLTPVCAVLFCAPLLVAAPQPADKVTGKPVIASVPTATAPAHPLRVIVGFMGGRVKASNLLHKEASMAQSLRDRNGADLKVLVFANHDGQAALRTVLNLVDQNGDHTISDAERQAANIAIYGHSWGASEAVNLARSLQKHNVPVALTVQVDSVQKSGENDKEIPSNVQEAVNLYQRGGILRGRDAIHAEDPNRTRIVVNQRYHYGPDHTIDIAQFPWFARIFMRQHIEIENDPEVWARVEDFLNGAVQLQRK